MKPNIIYIRYSQIDAWEWSETRIGSRYLSVQFTNGQSYRYDIVEGTQIEIIGLKISAPWDDVKVNRNQPA